jgi:hypothetical protein
MMLEALAGITQQQGAGGFDPDSISGLVGWWDASDTSTLTLSGSNVTAWADKSDAGYDLTNVAGTNPTSGATVNGLNAVNFSSSNTQLSGANDDPLNWVAADAKSHTVFFVWRTGPSFARFNWGMNVGGRLMVDARGNNTMYWDMPAAGARFTTSMSSSIWPTSTLTMSTNVRIGGTSRTIRKDGSVLATTGDSSGVVATGSGPYYLGQVAGVGQGTTGDICEVLHYAAGLSSTEVDSVETYLIDKWGI